MAELAWIGDYMGGLFLQDTIAVIWDFDKTLSPHYMQAPLFKRFAVEEKTFWDEVNGLEKQYIASGVNRVSKDTLYLNHILNYVRLGAFKGLNNALLRELGAEITFYDGIPELFDSSKQLIANNATFAKHEITVEHYVVSTGLREMVVGSKVAPFLEGIWGCEFVERQFGPGYDKEQQNLFRGEPVLTDVAYVIDNTSKTRALFEINKGTNKLREIGVNDTIALEERRVPFKNMIYIADGPSDIPAFSIVNQYGGYTFAVYKPRDEKEFRQVKNLQRNGRVQGIGEANYVPGSLTSMWLSDAIVSIARRMVADREALLNQKVGGSPQHILSDLEKRPQTVASVAKKAVEAASVASVETLPKKPVQAEKILSVEKLDKAKV